MSVTVRDATADDVPAVAAIYTHYTFRTTATFNIEVRTPREWRDRFEQNIVAGPYQLLVAIEGGVVVGYVETQQFRPKPAYRRSLEISVYVAPDLQARGVGSALFTAPSSRISPWTKLKRGESLTLSRLVRVPE
jgi:phosphinothricin acetyltransferase